MWNKNKALIEDLNRNLQPGMLTYLDDDIYSQIVSLKDITKKEVNENDIAEAIRTISDGTGIPVGEIVLSLKRLQRDRVSEDIRNISLVTGLPESEVEMQFLIPKLEKAAKEMNSMAQSFADVTKMLQAATSEYKNAEDIIQNFGKDLGKGAEYILTKDMAERLKKQLCNPTKVYFSKEPINIKPCSNEVFSEKQIFADTAKSDSVTTYRLEINGRIVKIQSYSNNAALLRDIQNDPFLGAISRWPRTELCRDDLFEIRERMTRMSVYVARHTSRHIPFYFKIFGQNRFVPKKNGTKDHTKFNRNVRPKGTHSHFKFYR
nr:MAG TPA_asm: hypothetical protein [Caudoviricetes sp.]